MAGNEALALARSELIRAGYRVASPSPVYGRRLVAFRDHQWETGLELHSVPGVRWRNVVLARAPSAIVTRRGVPKRMPGRPSRNVS